MSDIVFTINDDESDREITITISRTEDPNEEQAQTEKIEQMAQRCLKSIARMLGYSW